jgi:hypothetical protein
MYLRDDGCVTLMRKLRMSFPYLLIASLAVCFCIDLKRKGRLTILKTLDTLQSVNYIDPVFTLQNKGLL